MVNGVDCNIICYNFFSGLVPCRLKGTPLTSHESLKNMPFHERSIIALSVLHNLLQAGGQYNFRSSRAATVVELLHEKNGKNIDGLKQLTNFSCACFIVFKMDSLSHG